MASFPEREGYRLKPEWEEAYWLFKERFGDGRCSCFISAPCNSCLDEGNPENILETDEAWVPESLDLDLLEQNAKQSLQKALDASVRMHLLQMQLHSGHYWLMQARLEGDE